MRISLLLQREPFGAILEQTLATFLQAWTQQPHQVRWRMGRPNVGQMRCHGQQPWLCNIYLNAIFVPEADPHIFDPIRREFARSLAWWRRPVQQAYVAVGTGQSSAHWLAQAGVSISPGLPDARHLLIVAGNHKIRLLNCAQGIVYGVLKSGFPSKFMRQEIQTRQQAEKLGLPVPPLRSVAEDGAWFSEHYVSGTPVNRLNNFKTAQEAIASVMGALQRLLQETLHEEPLGGYITDLHDRIQELVNGNPLLSALQKRELLSNAATLVKQARDLRSVSGNVATALTHGDLQPANILLNERGAWLIDWEYAARRQAGYDALVLGLRVRFPKGLAARLQTFVAQGWGETAISAVNWTGAMWDTEAGRRLHADLFLLEELALRLEENANPCFVRSEKGLTILTQEISQWAVA